MVKTTGLSVFLVFFLATKLAFINQTTENRKILVHWPMARVLKWTGFFITSIIFFLISQHKLPGFQNFCVFSQRRLSPQSTAYSLWFNFDKTFVAAILCVCGNFFQGAQSKRTPIRQETRGQIQAMTWWRFFILLVLCIILLSGIGLVFGYIAWDIKWPSIMGIWCLNNLFFVCFAEEVFYRGFFQNQLRSVFPIPWQMYYPHIMLASIFFGLDHVLKGGLLNGILGCIAGFFYGYIYEKKQHIGYAILFHFLFNVIHIIFFTYPASISILN